MLCIIFTSKYVRRIRDIYLVLVTTKNSISYLFWIGHNQEIFKRKKVTLVILGSQSDDTHSFIRGSSIIYNDS